MVNKDMNGFPVKKCSAFQFFKKRVRRWIKSPMVSVDKHQSPSLKCTGPSVVHIPPPEPSFEPSFCQTCLGDHAFPRGVLSPEKESCSWETQSGCEVKEPCNHANILTKPDPRTFWTNDDSVPEAYLPSGTAFWISKYIRVLGDGAEKLISFLERVTKEQDEEGKDPGPSLPSRGQRVSKPEDRRSGGHSHPQHPEPHFLQSPELPRADHRLLGRAYPPAPAGAAGPAQQPAIGWSRAYNSCVRPPEFAANFDAYYPCDFGQMIAPFCASISFTCKYAILIIDHRGL